MRKNLRLRKKYDICYDRITNLSCYNNKCPSIKECKYYKKSKGVMNNTRLVSIHDVLKILVDLEMELRK